MIKRLICLSLILLSGCAFGPKMKWLDMGQDRHAVIEKLGRPDGSVPIADKVEKLQYSQRHMRYFSGDYADYYVLLYEDKVIGYGTGEIRANTSNTSFIIPLNPIPPEQPGPMSPGEYQRGMQQFGH